MRPVHYEVEVLYDTTFTTACGSRAGKNVTKDDAQVTCGKCLAAMGYEVGALAHMSEAEQSEYFSPSRAPSAQVLQFPRRAA